MCDRIRPQTLDPTQPAGPPPATVLNHNTHATTQAPAPVATSTIVSPAIPLCSSTELLWCFLPPRCKRAARCQPRPPGSARRSYSPLCACCCEGGQMRLITHNMLASNVKVRTRLTLRQGWPLSTRAPSPAPAAGRPAQRFRHASPCPTRQLCTRAGRAKRLPAQNRGHTS